MPERLAAPPPATAAPCSEDWLLRLTESGNAALCGGKAAGLARLRRAGFPVPDGICLTTNFCRAALREIDVAARVREIAAVPSMAPQERSDRLADIRRLIQGPSLSAHMVETIQGGTISMRSRWNGMLAVRSSALLEDHADASHAGIHVSFIGQYSAAAVIARVKACWASLWTDRAWAYREHLGLPHVDAAMAVVVQRFVAGGRAGVALSADPITGERNTVVIEAARGTGAAVVGTSEHYRVTVRDKTPTFVRAEVASAQRVLTDAEARTLARLVKRVEHTLQVPADVEWAYDGSTFWVVQARPIGRAGARRDDTLWTRANLKEVFPDQPSPLAVSYLSVALTRMFRAYNSARGYKVPGAAHLVGVVRGRPYLNLTLMNRMAAARGEDPEIVSRLFGGPARPPARDDRAASRPISGVRQGARLAGELLTAVVFTPRRAHGLFRTIRRQAKCYAAVAFERLDDAAVNRHLTRLANTLLRPVMLRRVHDIVSAQSRAYMLLERLLSAWLPRDAERLLAELMTGLGTLPNTRLTYRLVRLSEVARTEPCVEAFLTNAGDSEILRDYRSALAGTRFLADLDGVLHEFGHRGPYESDVMSPRFAEEPEPLLRVVQMYLRLPTIQNPRRREAYRRFIRQSAEREARLLLRKDRSWLTFALQWPVLSVVCGALQRLLAHRDENRHVTTLLVTQLRRVALEIGHRAARDGRLAAGDDVFFVLWNELPDVLGDPHHDWSALIAERRRERARDAAAIAPDLLRRDEPADDDAHGHESHTGDTLMGVGVSPGTVTGTVKIITSPVDLRALCGEIAVLPAVEPSLASIFPAVSGLVVEMGGVLSHAAILAREYGLPAVVNVQNVTRRLRDGDCIELDGSSGRIRLLGRTLGDERRDRKTDQRAGDHV